MFMPLRDQWYQHGQSHSISYFYKCFLNCIVLIALHRLLNRRSHRKRVEGVASYYWNTRWNRKKIFDFKGSEVWNLWYEYGRHIFEGKQIGFMSSGGLFWCSGHPLNSSQSIINRIIIISVLLNSCKKILREQPDFILRSTLVESSSLWWYFVD